MIQTVGDRPDYGAFIPSQLDDYPLSMPEFRLFCHISRRAGTTEGKFWEAAEKAAAHCKMEVKTYTRTLTILEQAGLIRVVKRPGKTSDIRLMHYQHWVDPEKLTEIRKSVPSPRKRPTPDRTDPTPTGSHRPNPHRIAPTTYPGSHRPLTPDRTDPTPTGSHQPLTPDRTDKGTPSKVIPLEGIPNKVIKEEEPLPSVAFSENDFLESPSDSEISALRAATLEFSALEPAETELAALEFNPLSTSIIKTADDVPRALAGLCPALEKKESAKHENDAFQMLWKLYKENWAVLSPTFPKTPGTKISAAKAWDALFKGVGKNSETLAQTIIYGTTLYWEEKIKAGDRAVLSAAVCLSQGAWKQAIEKKAEPAPNDLKRYANFLDCWNQDRPMNWPQADSEDLSPKSTTRLEELIASCPNSLERFQKALHWAKRDPYWGLQRSQTLEEFLYSGRINEFYKKQINAEANGIGDRLNIAPLKSMAADLRFAEKAKRVEMELRAEGLIT